MWKINFAEDKLVYTLRYKREDLLNIGKNRMTGFTCRHCGRWYRYAKNLKSHSSDQCGRSFNRADNLQTHMRNCTGRCVAVPTVAAPSAKKRCT